MYIYALALKAAAPTVIMVCLRAWLKEDGNGKRIPIIITGNAVYVTFTFLSV